MKPWLELERWTGQLHAVHAELCQIEEELRLQEEKQDFGERFVVLARAERRKNGERAEIQRAVNQLLGLRSVDEPSCSREP